jgi:hypothetical protein
VLGPARELSMTRRSLIRDMRVICGHADARIL